MEVMQRVAKRHNLVCLLHEKPFKGVNGSGKHNNWSISTDTGINLLEPGETPADNAQFLLFLCAVIKAVDEYQDLLRISVASAGNDHRLGANEAPPAIVSMFLGDELSGILEAIEMDTSYDSGKEKEILKIGVHTLPKFPKDTTDRNRTSPFAFTGNKFEFRMLGSSASISSANIVLNTAVAEELRQFADILETTPDFESDLHSLIKSVIKNHKRIIFNGNGYDDLWEKEAIERGLLNLKTTPDALPYLLKDKNIKLFAAHKVFNEAELRSRYEIYMENYCKVLNIEALTMLDMVNKDVLPAVTMYSQIITDTALKKKQLSKSIDCFYEENTVRRISDLLTKAFQAAEELDKGINKSKSMKDITQKGNFFRDKILSEMNTLRDCVDELENLTSSEYWPYHTYGQMLYSVK